MSTKILPLITEGSAGLKAVRGELESLTESKGIETNNLEQAKRRLYFNGSSYSGADIKVVVHRYKAGPEEILPEIESAVLIYKEVAEILEDLRINHIPFIDSLRERYKSGEVELEIYRAIFDERWTENINSIRTKEQSLIGSTYHQYIGDRVSTYTVTAQSDPLQLRSELYAIRNLLLNLTESWAELTRSIKDRSGPSNFFQTKVLAELQTISISTYREKNPVRGFGAARTKGFVRGTRTVAGTMIFTVFDRNVFLNLLDIDPTDFDADDQFTSAIMDQMPPMDISILFANEYGSLSRMTLYGVEFVSEGKTMSIEDLLLEHTVQFVARDIDPMTPVLSDEGQPYNEILSAYNQANNIIRRPESLAIRGSDLIGSEWDSREGENTADTRFRNRFTPFF